MRHVAKPGVPPPPFDRRRQQPHALADHEVERILYLALCAAGERGLDDDELGRIVHDLEAAVIGYGLVCAVLRGDIVAGIVEGEVMYRAADAGEAKS